MKSFLVFSGIVSLVFGVLFLFLPEVLKRISNFCNRAISNLDDKMHRLNKFIGIVLLAAGLVILYIARSIA